VQTRRNGKQGIDNCGRKMGKTQRIVFRAMKRIKIKEKELDYRDWWD